MWLKYYKKVVDTNCKDAIIVNVACCYRHFGEQYEHLFYRQVYGFGTRA
nr:MAG TPA: hypothetical protein [Caudoviricetes sp.]